MSRTQLDLPAIENLENVAQDKCSVYGRSELASIIKRELISLGQIFTGPLIMRDTVSTTYIAPSWQCHMNQQGNLLLKKV